MLQSRIVNEVNGNYLLIVSNEQNISGFEFKMFEYNNIKGFLPISLVRINNTVTYRYPVMQCQSLAKKFGSEQVSMTDIKLIFSEITLLVHRAEEYLLNMDSVLFLGVGWGVGGLFWGGFHFVLSTLFLKFFFFILKNGLLVVGHLGVFL